MQPCYQTLNQKLVSLQFGTKIVKTSLIRYFNVETLARF